MYLAIDVGGTKTLLGVFDPDGSLLTTLKFPTSHDYQTFTTDLAKAVKEMQSTYSFKQACCALPGSIDRQNGILEHCGNLPWQNVPARDDLTNLLGMPVTIENDAKLGGLSEALLLGSRYHKVQYLTISTGIGGGLIVNGVIDPTMSDEEPGHMILEHEGKLQRWEAIASGSAIVAQYGQRASEIVDPEIWRAICRPIALGIINVVAGSQPDVVVIGGGVGAHFDRYGTILREELEKLRDPMVPIPEIVGAQNAEEAVIFGCYEYIKQQL